MIKINLARKRRTSAGGGGAGLSFDLKSIFSGLSSGGKGADSDSDGPSNLLSSPIARIVLSVVAFYAVDYVITSMKTEEITKLNQQIATLEADKKNIASKLQKLDAYRPLQQQLEADEKVIKSKLEVVTRLLENRVEPAKILFQIAKKIPEDVWLSDLRLSASAATISGGTPNSNSISDFSNSLSSIPAFSRVEIKDIREVTPTGKETKYQQFELSAARKVGI